MPRINLVLESPVSTSVRARQLEAMFDVPRAEKSRVVLKGNLPIDAKQKPWHVGLIVGPSGSGKSSIARKVWGDAVSPPLEWKGASVIDDFAEGESIERIAEICQAVGFNTIPAWLRPFDVLSTGERFRVEIARRLLEQPDPIVVDEFTSVVDRQVAKIGSHAVQKFIRKHDRRFVAVTCHYDVEDWLQPDWTFEPATGTFTWRDLQPRPTLQGTIARVDKAAWHLFARYHYLSANLHRSARCFCLFIEGRPVSFVGVIHRPHPKARNVKGITRGVTLPDWQGLGCIFHLQNAVGAAYRALGYRLHAYPAHPGYMRAMDQSKDWALVRRPMTLVPTGKTSSIYRPTGKWAQTKGKPQGRARGATQGTRPCATFRYAGPAMPVEDARRLLGV